MDREHYIEYYRLKYNNALADRILNEIKYIMSKDGTFTTYLINEPLDRWEKEKKEL